MSNFACIAVEVSCRRYTTGEHAFHGEKFFFLAQQTLAALEASDSQVDECFREAARMRTRIADLKAHAERFVGDEPKLRTALDAKRAGGRRGLELNDNEIAFWAVHAPEMQRLICESKFLQNKDVQLALTQCRARGQRLLHLNARAKSSDIWGARVRKTGDPMQSEADELIGHNTLGKIWEQFLYREDTPCEPSV
jgi:predicted NAD-dependent protein-ADP-ribosyltransferase YbiA (DUF1768 family)